MNPKTMRKTLSFYKTKTLGSKAAPLHLSFGFYTFSIVISNWWSKDERTFALELEFCSIPAIITSWYRYHFASGDFLLGGTGTDESGTGTTWPLLISCFGVPVPLPLHLFSNIIALPKTSPQRLPSSSMIHICSLGTNPCNNYA